MTKPTTNPKQRPPSTGPAATTGRAAVVDGSVGPFILPTDVNADRSSSGRRKRRRRPLIVVQPVEEDLQTLTIMRRWFLRLTGYSALGYYLSILIHAMIIANAVWVLWMMDLLVIVTPVESHEAVRASLADEEISDDDVLIEALPEVTFETVGGTDAPDPLASMTMTAPSDIASTMPSPAEMFQSPGSGQGVGDASGDGIGFKFKMPAGGRAVTKGSFTAWTEPAEPEPRRPYHIVIEVRLPSDVTRYKISDLSGTVIGNDGYEQRIPWDARFRTGTMTTVDGNLRPIGRSQSLPIRDHRVQIVVAVPGGNALVQDTIQIESRRLKEEQTLTIQFLMRDRPDNMTE